MYFHPSIVFILSVYNSTCTSARAQQKKYLPSNKFPHMHALWLGGRDSSGKEKERTLERIPGTSLPSNSVHHTSHHQCAITDVFSISSVDATLTRPVHLCDSTTVCQVCPNQHVRVHVVCRIPYLKYLRSKGIYFIRELKRLPVSLLQYRSLATRAVNLQINFGTGPLQCPCDVPQCLMFFNYNLW